MSDRPSSTPGILTLDTTTNVKDFNIALSIPQQTIVLKGYRVQMSSAATALSTRLLYIDLPFFSGNQMLDANLSRVYLPIALDNAIVTNQYGIDLPVYLDGFIPEKFQMRVLDSSFAVSADMVSVTLQFALSYGHLN